MYVSGVTNLAALFCSYPKWFKLKINLYTDFVCVLRTTAAIDLHFKHLLFDAIKKLV
jgi:hypothetical protein